MEKTKIVVLGAGYAGIRTVKGLQNKNLDAEITLINKNNYHYEATYLHEVAAGTNKADKICFNIDEVINTKKIKFIKDTVIRVNKREKTVSLKKNKDVPYDYLVVALGFEAEYFGIPGVEEYAWPVVDIRTAEAAKAQLDNCLANYKKTKDKKDLSIVVCGAGFTSIEYLGEITNRLPKLSKQLGFPMEKVKITCIEAMPTLLPMFSEKLSSYGVEVLKKRGVRFKIGTPIKEIKKDRVVYHEGDEQKEVKANTIIWTTGVRGSRVIEESGFDGRRGRVVVNKDLTVPGYPEVFMIGDVSAVIDKKTGLSHPTTAQIALKEADHVVKNLVAKLNKQKTKEFTFKSAGTVASIGNNQAIAEVAGKEFKGYIASVMKKGVADKSLLQVANPKILLKKGRFDFYH